jgi:hypothetical protein
MARLMPVDACLLATLLVAGAMPTQAGDPLLDQPTPQDAVDLLGYGPACTKSGDDSGFGGTHLSCKYACLKANLLAIGGSASDAGATAYGDTACGGVAATCRSAGPACQGVSPGVTRYAQGKASCNGDTDEWWDSPMTIACAADGADPEGLVCELVEDLCDLDLTSTQSATLGPAELLAACQRAVSLHPSLGGLVLAQAEAGAFAAVQYVPGAGCQASAGRL